MELQNPEFRKELNVSAEQETKLEVIFAKSRAGAQELSKVRVQAPNPPEDEFQQKLQELGKQDRQQIAEVLTPPQLATLKKRTLRQAVLRSLDFAARFGAQQPGFLERIQVSDQQKEQLRRLHEEKERMMLQMNRERGEKALKVLSLSPQQQEKLFEELSAHPGGEEPAASDEPSPPTKGPAAAAQPDAG
jgi:hypothetical protein